MTKEHDPMTPKHTAKGTSGSHGRRPRGWFAAVIAIVVSTAVVAQSAPTTPAPASASAGAKTAAPPAGTAATGAIPSSPSKPGTPPAGASDAPLPASTADYIVGPGDTIQVFVWRNPELTTTVPVRPDGKISTPLVEDLVAVGKTPAQLARDVEGRLAEYVRSPQVSIIVSNAVSAFNQVRVVGEVKNPHALPFQEGMTLLDAVLASGGLTEFASGNRAKLLRKDVHGKDVEIRVRLEDLLKKGKLKENRPVQPGDLILVPQAWF
jgi:polysaccharide export outer membrane protein